MAEDTPCSLEAPRDYSQEAIVERLRNALAWSNRDAQQSVLIARALASANYAFILDAVIGFGLDAVQASWQEVKQEASVRSQTNVERMLRNIEAGLRDASAASSVRRPAR